jgi:hypothetical protein
VWCSGKPEIWAALKAAAEAVGREDYAMGQAILDGAGVSLPGGRNRENIRYMVY